jgi:hypothetical protein
VWRRSRADRRARGSPHTAAAGGPPSRAPASARCASAAPAPPPPEARRLPIAGARGLDVEGIRARPRRVRRAVVERVEVVVNRLHLRPLHHGEAEAQEDVFQLAHRGGEQVQRPIGCGGAPGSVTSTRSSSRRRSKLLLCPSWTARASIKASSACSAWLAALPTATRCGGLQLRDAHAASAAAQPCGRDSARAILQCLTGGQPRRSPSPACARSCSIRSIMTPDPR